MIYFMTGNGAAMSIGSKSKVKPAKPHEVVEPIDDLNLGEPKAEPPRVIFGGDSHK